MPPIITPAQRKKRFSGLAKLHTALPSAEVKREQRKRKAECINLHDKIKAAATKGSPIHSESVCKVGSVVMCEERHDNMEPQQSKYYKSNDFLDCLSDNESKSTLSSESDSSAESSALDDEEQEDDLQFGNSNIHYMNKIINFEALKDMVESRCTCRSCNGAVVLTEITVGVATTIIMTCTNCDENSKRTETGPAKVNGHDICAQQGIRDKPKFVKKSIDRFIDFPIHYSLVLLMQQLGCGLEGIRAVLSHLFITSTIGDWEKWRLLMEAVGTAQQQIANDCMIDNIKEEIWMSHEAGQPTQQDSNAVLRQGLTVSIDMGWQKRSSGTQYDSPSGVSLMIGGLSKKILQRHVCGKLCSICSKSKTCTIVKERVSRAINTHRCPLNYEGTSKGMEAAAAVECVRGLFHTSTNFKDCSPAFVDAIISDDDSSTWANLQQSLTMRLQMINEQNSAAGLPLLTERQASFWPKKSRGNPKKTMGSYICMN